MSMDFHSLPDMPEVSTSTLEQLRIVVTEPDEARRAEMVNRFLEQRFTMFRNQAVRFCRENSVPSSQWHDDVTALVAEEAYRMVREALADPGVLDKIFTWEGMLYHRARVRVRSYTDANVLPVSGVTSAMRRYREVAKTRNQMRTRLHREPTDDEVIEATNARMRSLRKDPARQGLTITAEDLALPQASFDPEEIDRTHVDFVDHCALHPAEGSVVVQRTVAVCYRDGEDERLGRVADMWLSDAYSASVVGSDTVSRIAKELATSPRIVHELIARVRELAVEVLAEMGVPGWGVDFS